MPRREICTAQFEEDRDICALARQSKYTRDFASHMFFRADIQNTYAKGEVGAAIQHGKVVGFVYCKHLKTKNRPYSVIHYMAVDPSCHGRGIGRRLLDWALSASPHGRVQLSCEHSNINGMKFYERCGFQVVYTGVYGEKTKRPYTRFERRISVPVAAAAG